MHNKNALCRADFMDAKFALFAQLMALLMASTINYINLIKLN